MHRQLIYSYYELQEFLWANIFQLVSQFLSVIHRGATNIHHHFVWNVITAWILNDNKSLSWHPAVLNQPKHTGLVSSGSSVSYYRGEWGKYV